MKQMKRFYWGGGVKISLGKLNGLFCLNGALKKQVLKEPVILNPISSKSMHFEEKELDTGGEMAGCFIIVWESRKKVSEPIIEGIIGKSGTGRVTSSVFYGRVIEDDSR